MTRSPVAEIPAGSFGDQTFHASWKLSLPAIAIDLRVTTAPSLAGTTTLSIDQPATFTVSSESGLADISWRWDGELPIDGETAMSYTLEAYAKEPGIYELSVVASDENGKKLSARCRVTITAE
jgi:hypothetical protein